MFQSPGFSVINYVNDNLLIGDLSASYFRFIMKKMLMQILQQNLRIVLSLLKIIGALYHETINSIVCTKKYKYLLYFILYCTVAND